MSNFLKIIAGLFLIILFLWMAGFIVFFINMAMLKPLNITQKTDAIVVLTGGNYRVATGLDLWNKNLAPELFISGVNKTTNRREILRTWTDKDPLPLCCLTLGYEATTTRENASETKEWVDDNAVRSLRLVTSTYHMRRAVMELKTAMPDLKLIIHPVEKTDYQIHEWRFWKILILEYSKTLARKIEILSGQDLF